MKIGIIGLGLIGGSLGFDFVQAGHQVIGVSRRESTGEAAVQRGAVHQSHTDLSALRGADLVFICTPIEQIVATTATLAPYLADGAVVTDVGSAKAAVVEAATQIWPYFVGGHPMAGKAEAGLDAAQPGLFKQRPYVLTPLAVTPPEALQRVADRVHELGSQLIYSEPALHDRAVAWISHLPVMVSSSLIQACLSEADPAVAHLARSLASSGFRDTSRVGGGNPELGLMMAKHNRLALLQTLQAYQQQIEQLTAWIQAEDWDSITQFLIQTEQARPDFVESGA